MGRAHLVGALAQGRAVALQAHFALDQVAIERVHHVADFFASVQVCPDNFMRVRVRLELLQDCPVLFCEPGNELLHALLLFVEVRLALLRLRLHRLEVLGFTLERRLLVRQLLYFNL